MFELARKGGGLFQLTDLHISCGMEMSMISPFGEL